MKWRMSPLNRATGDGGRFSYFRDIREGKIAFPFDLIETQGGRDSELPLLGDDESSPWSTDARWRREEPRSGDLERAQGEVALFGVERVDFDANLVLLAVVDDSCITHGPHA
ncbi:hypothetical protein CEXT_140241 [Caerostris extrusa]|uniref:Uncharacterized protein n=1 Tax=Caerostris extrusa TaxID=172846 RepID=A0AAV4XP97_CAEEX|nr:hypothetical protein CEXT_140241 [Caerostris extrusa]